MEELRLRETEYNRILDIKRDLHMHPEIAHEEFRTTETIKEFLRTVPGADISSKASHLLVPGDWMTSSEPLFILACRFLDIKPN